MALTSKQRKMAEYILDTRATAPAEVADQHPEYFSPWVYSELVEIGSRRRDDTNGLLYEVYASAGDNLYPPSQVPAVWKRVYNEEWPEWVQPTGSHDAYAKGDKVIHNSIKWISEYDSNTWEPGVFGWTEVTG